MEYFLDMDKKYNDYRSASVVLLPVPYDGTSTFVKGADKGPQAIIDASDSIELYDVEEDIEIYLQGIHTAQPVENMNTPQQMVESVYRRTKDYLADDKLLCLLGGEHSVSCGAIKAVSEKYSHLSVLQLDAHADMRDEYQNSPFNHACVMRRAKDFADIVQVGLRSVEAEERKNMDMNHVFYAHAIYGKNDWMQRAIDQLTDNVYLTIDLDVFDPSILPSTGTPYPGGMQWRETLDFLSMVIAQKNVVAFDVVELCPNPAEKSSDVLAAVLIYRLIGKILKKRMNK
ncbi:MAG: agmatinase [Bacteroidales bacterium]|nr:agmatinase [Bacteroidales bacterium]